LWSRCCESSASTKTNSVPCVSSVVKSEGPFASFAPPSACEVLAVKSRFLLPVASVLVLLAGCGDDADTSSVSPTQPGADAAADVQPGSDAGSDAAKSDAAGDASNPDQDGATDGSADVISDGSAETGAEAGNDASACVVDPQTPADGVRTVLSTHPYAGSGSACGRMVHVSRLDAQGTITATGQTIDVGDCPQRVSFSPDGRLALVVVANGHDPAAGMQRVVVLRNDAKGNVTIAGEMPEFSLTNPTEAVFSLDGTKAYVPDTDKKDGAVHVIDVVPGCSASYSKKISMPLPSRILPLPGGKYAILLAGKDANNVDDPNDVAILDLQSETVISNLDLFEDWTDAYSVSLSPDGKYLAVPNSSPFSSLMDTVSTLAIDTSGAQPTATLAYTLQNITEPTGVQWSPSGTKLAVSTFSGNKVQVLNAGANGVLSVGPAISGISLASYISMIKRGPNTGMFLVTSLTSVVVARFTDAGAEEVSEFSFGSGYEAMVNDVAVEP